MNKKGCYETYFKRLFDITLSIIALALTSPIFIMLIFIVWIKMGSPVFFKQLRPGQDEKIFPLLKFRSMTNKKDENGMLLPDDMRLNKLGLFLRKTSLDELPSLINIIMGHMSIVGPRPLLVDYLPLYDEFQKKRHTVKPGLTGLAQINGRNAISWDEKFKYDIKYVQNISFFLDISIIFKTVYKVIFRHGISSETSLTMERFTGNKSIF